MKRKHFLHLPAVRKKWLTAVLVIGILAMFDLALVATTMNALGKTLGAVLVVIGLIITLLISRSMWGLKSDSASSLVTERNVFPALWDIVHQYADVIGRDPPAILISPNESDIPTSFSYTEHGPTLTITEGDLDTVHGSDVRAIVAHELGHYAGNDLKIKKTFVFVMLWLYGMSIIVFTFSSLFLVFCIATSHQIPQVVTILIERSMLGGFVYYWASIYLYIRLVHAVEFSADAVAANILGSNEIIVQMFEREVMLMGYASFTHTNPSPNFFTHPPHMDRINALRGKK